MANIQQPNSPARSKQTDSWSARGRRVLRRPLTISNAQSRRFAWIGRPWVRPTRRRHRLSVLVRASGCFMAACTNRPLLWGDWT